MENATHIWSKRLLLGSFGKHEVRGTLLKKATRQHIASRIMSVSTCVQESQLFEARPSGSEGSAMRTNCGREKIAISGQGRPGVISQKKVGKIRKEGKLWRFDLLKSSTFTACWPFLFVFQLFFLFPILGYPFFSSSCTPSNHTTTLSRFSPSHLSHLSVIS